MLFGKGGKAEEVELDELEVLLASLFDKKISAFASKAAGTTKELERARLQFGDACNRFNQLNAEPEIENIYIDTSAFLKSQKGFYSTALRRIIDDWSIFGNESSNMHNKYTIVLSNAEKFINETLRANSNFKKVLHSYSNHLDNFKRSFSLIEKNIGLLKSELDKVESELGEYTELNNHIRELYLLKHELAALDKSIAALNRIEDSDDTNAINKHESELSNSISKKEGELSKINSDASAILNKINLYLLPLERATRKLDHISSRKRHLYNFISDPIGNINDENDYKEFVTLVEELKKSVDTGIIDTKNNAKVSQNAQELLNADIYGMIMEFKTTKSKKSGIMEEMEFSKRMLSRLEGDRNNSEKTLKDMELMKKSASDSQAKKEKTKTRIEELFSEYYNKKISVII